MKPTGALQVNVSAATLGNGAAPAAALVRHAQLPASIAPGTASVQSGGDKLLLTGATGYLGRYLIEALLEQTDAEILCLVRASDRSRAAERLVHSLPEGRHDADRRVHVVLSDLSAPGLGLARRDYQALAAEVGAIYHCGAWVNFSRSYAELEPANVGGTIELLRLATARHLIPFHFVSSLGVLASGAPADQTESDEPDELTDAGWLATGYQQTKWVADRLVSQARRRGLPASIYRVGLLGGDSRTGCYERLDEYFPSLLKGCIQLGAGPALNSGTALVPVDYTARAIVHLSKEHALPGSTYHIDHPEPMAIRDFMTWLAGQGYPLAIVPFAEWRNRLFELPISLRRQNALYPYLGFIRNFAEIPPFEPSRTRARLRALALPALTELCARYLQHFVRAGFLAPPPAQICTATASP